MCWLTVGCRMPSREAAWVKLPVCSTARSVVSSSGSNDSAIAKHNNCSSGECGYLWASRSGEWSSTPIPEASNSDHGHGRPTIDIDNNPAAQRSFRAEIFELPHLRLRPGVREPG